eukprot:GFUD01056418.1.p1 GENE.GFUD01056418.1~~GFUD01056418.1.p1  ORF type:complete len:294 (+),score=70.45 GFUD01056418.1:109-990(+)
MFIIFLMMVLLSNYKVIRADSDKSQLEYLERYGYLELEDGDDIVATRSGQSVRRALLKFQAFAGLELTGEVDKVTRKKMNTPRCGVSDVIANFVLEGSKWQKQELTFSILNYPTTSRLSNKDVDRAVEKAFSIWQKGSNLVFKRNNFGTADIEISFGKYDHGDDQPFDGQGGTLAHAFFPQFGGDIHVDDSENWTVDEFNGKDFLQTIVHELGHSLGLDHSDVTSSVMAPFYRGWDPFLRLMDDDIKAIASLYGSKKKKQRINRRKPKISSDGGSLWKKHKSFGKYRARVSDS